MRDERGITLLDLLLASAIFLMVAAGIGSLYVGTMRAFTQGSAQAFLQRQGTLVQEELKRLALHGTGLPAGPCNGVALPSSQQVLRAVDALCFYRSGSDNQIYVCTWSGTACSNTRNLLAGAPQPIRAPALTFIPLVTTGVSPSVDVAFELQVNDQSDPPVRFAMNLTLRN